MNKNLLFYVLTFVMGFSFAQSIELPDGGVFNGTIINGLFEGEGKITWKTGDTYIGDFKSGLYDGFGFLVTRMYEYEGDFQNGLFNGLGRLKFSNGTEYTGNFVDGLYYGEGRLIDNAGNFYAGKFVNNQKDGLGFLKLHNGDTYYGNFKNDFFEGRGVYTFLNGDQYVGEFKTGLFHGDGKLKLGNDVYEGDFVLGELPTNYRQKPNFPYQNFIYLLFLVSLILNIFFILKRRKFKLQ